MSMLINETETQQLTPSQPQIIPQIQQTHEIPQVESEDNLREDNSVISDDFKVKTVKELYNVTLYGYWLDQSKGIWKTRDHNKYQINDKGIATLIDGSQVPTDIYQPPSFSILEKGNLNETRKKKDKKEKKREKKEKKREKNKKRQKI